MVVAIGLTHDLDGCPILVDVALHDRHAKSRALFAHRPLTARRPIRIKDRGQQRGVHAHPTVPNLKGNPMIRLETDTDRDLTA